MLETVLLVMVILAVMIIAIINLSTEIKKLQLELAYVKECEKNDSEHISGLLDLFKEQSDLNIVWKDIWNDHLKLNHGYVEPVEEDKTNE